MENHLSSSLKKLCGRILGLSRRDVHKTRTVMIELYYLDALDLMLKIEYTEGSGKLRYATHRKMRHDEKVTTEEYLLTLTTAKPLSFSSRRKLVYLGIDKGLKNKLATLQQESAKRIPPEKEKEIETSVRNLINISMRNYYSEKIGDLLMTARRDLCGGRRLESRHAPLQQRMETLVQAYNVYADQKVTLQEVVPSELKPLWPGLADDPFYGVSAR